MDLLFSRTLGQAAAKAHLSRLFAGSGLPGGFLVHGEKGLGQNALLLDLLEIALCTDASRRPCGLCPPCREREKGLLGHVILVFPFEKKVQDSPEARAEETLRKRALLEANPYAEVRTDKEHLTVGQVRELQERLSRAEGGNRSRLVLLFEADALNESAANALLKVLEEPPRNTHFLLSTARKSALLPTILSRLQKLPLSPLSGAEFEAGAGRLEAWSGKPFSALLVPLSEGSAGAYLAWNRQGLEDLLEEAEGFLADFCAAEEGRWMPLSKRLEKSEIFAQLEGAAGLLRFLLQLRRLHLRHATEGLSYPSHLSSFLTALGRVRDADRFTRYLEDSLAAVEHYGKPAVVLLGNFFAYESAKNDA